VSGCGGPVINTALNAVFFAVIPEWFLLQECGQCVKKLVRLPVSREPIGASGYGQEFFLKNGKSVVVCQN
jgi:hypothetical protein